MKTKRPMNTSTPNSPRSPERVEALSDGANSVSLRVEADNTATYGGYLYMTHAQAAELVRQLLAQGFGKVTT